MKQTGTDVEQQWSGAEDEANEEQMKGVVRSGG